MCAMPGGGSRDGGLVVGLLRYLEIMAGVAAVVVLRSDAAQKGFKTAGSLFEEGLLQGPSSSACFVTSNTQSSCRSTVRETFVRVVLVCSDDQAQICGADAVVSQEAELACRTLFTWGSTNQRSTRRGPRLASELEKNGQSRAD
jgi:hypothetical protein